MNCASIFIWDTAERHVYLVNSVQLSYTLIASASRIPTSGEWTTIVTRPLSSLQPGTMPNSSAISSTGHNPKLRLLNALRAGSKPIMTFLGLPSFRAAQIIAQTGLDVSIILLLSQKSFHFSLFQNKKNEIKTDTHKLKGIIVDCEHGHISDDAMHSSTAAISALGISPLVRLRMTHPDLIKRALDAGAQ